MRVYIDRKQFNSVFEQVIFIIKHVLVRFSVVVLSYVHYLEMFPLKSRESASISKKYVRYWEMSIREGTSRY